MVDSPLSQRQLIGNLPSYLERRPLTKKQQEFVQQVEEEQDPGGILRSRFKRPAPAGLMATPQVQEPNEESSMIGMDSIKSYLGNLFSPSTGAPPAIEEPVTRTGVRASPHPESKPVTRTEVRTSPHPEPEPDGGPAAEPSFAQSVDDPDLQVYSQVESTLLPFLRTNEGFISKLDTAVEDKGKANPTKDIGYGHKLSAEELKDKEVYGIDVSKGISKDQADFILSKDLEKKYEQVSKKIPNFKNLTPLEQALVTDFEFNVRGGIKAFPKMLKALQARDVQTLNKEYKRYMGTREEIRNKSKPLKKRNETTYSTFIAPLTRKYENKAGNLVASNPNPYPARVI